MKKKRKKRTGSLGTATATKRKGKNRFSPDNLKDETAPILLVAAGVIAANFIGKTVDGFVKPEESVVKKMIKPLVLAGAGLAVRIMTDNKMFKDFGTGLAVGGVLSGVKTATKQNLVEHLSGDLESLNPDLPDIAGYLESGFDGELANLDEELADIDGEVEYVEYVDGDDDDIDGDLESDDDDLDGDDDDDLSGRKRKGGRGRKGGGKRRRALPPADVVQDAEVVDFA